LRRISENKFLHSQSIFSSRREIALTRLIGDVHSCRRNEVTSVRGKSACVYALRAFTRDSSLIRRCRWCTLIQRRETKWAHLNGLHL